MCRGVRVIVFPIIFSLCLAGMSCSDQHSDETAESPLIRFWHIYNDPVSSEVLRTIGSEFEALHPNVRIDVVNLDNIEYKQKLTLQFAAADAPEIYHSWGGGDLIQQAKDGYARDITDFVQSDTWPAPISPVVQELYSWNGRVYGFPHDLGAVGFWYNRDLLRRAGYESFPREWEGLLGLLESLKARGITPISLGMVDQWPVTYYWVYLAMRIGGADIFGDILKGTREFDDPALIEAAEIMQEFYEGEFLPPSHIADDFLSQSRRMGDGESAMQLMGQWALAIQAQAAELGDELNSLMSFAPFPTVDGGIGGINDVMGGGNGFAVGSGAPDEALEFLAYFAEPENLQRLFDAFPAVPTVREVSIDSPSLNLVRNYVDEADNYSLYPDQMFPQEIGALLNDIATRIMLGELTPQQGCAELKNAWDAVQDH